jgi:3-oxoacyl-(acyl-carrier-protein) synthase
MPGMINRHPVPITGIGCLCAAGEDLNACMTALFRDNGIRPSLPTRFQTTDPMSCPVYELDAAARLHASLQYQPYTLTASMALEAASQALENAGWSPQSLKNRRVGVCVGTTVGAIVISESTYYQFITGQHPDIRPMIRNRHSNPATAIARQFDLSGPCQTVVNACASGTDAIGIAASWIQSGLCDVALAGGTDELSRISYMGFLSLKIMDPNPCRPFDRDRNGLNLGEGAAILVLESSDVNRSSGKTPRAFVMGYGAAGDAYHLTAPRPDGKGLVSAINQALRRSGVNPEHLAFINCHGTGTRDNDRVESHVLAAMLPRVPYLSTKGYTGHTLGAAGAIEAALSVACLETGVIPASAGFETPDPDLPSCPVAAAKPVFGNAALSQSLAFGGHNAVLVIGKDDSA